MKTHDRKDLASSHREAARERGSLIFDVAIGIAVFVGLISIVLAAVGPVQRTMQNLGVSREVVNISSETRALFMNRPDFSTLDASTLISAQAVPSGSVSGADIVNSLGGVIIPGPASDPALFELIITGLTEQNCVRLAPVAASGDSDIGIGIAEMEVGTFNGSTFTAITAAGDGETRIASTGADGFQGSEMTDDCAASNMNALRVTYAR